MKSRWVLETPHLGLRAMRARDLDFLVSMLGDPAVMRHISGPLDHRGAGQWIRRQIDRYSRDGHGLWIIVEKATDAPVGQAGLLEQILDDDAVTEVSWMIARPFWRRGFATAAGRCALDHAFGPLDRTRVVAFVRPENVASAGVARKLGMRRIGATTRAGLLHDVFSVEPATAG